MATEPVHRTVPSNGIDLHVVEAGEGPLVLLCHGWPEVWYSWRHQLPVLADAGYRVVAPDLRGYGASSRPEAVADYDIVHLTDDLTGLLDALGEERAVVIGHDWGAMIVWALAQRAPERVEAVAAMSVPFRPRASRRPTDILRAVHGDGFFYILYFQEEGPADAELGADPALTLRRVLYTVSGDAPPGAWRPGRAGDGMLDGLSEPERLPRWLTDADLVYLASQFTASGFTGGLNYYRNIDRNWELEEAWAGRRIEAPALFLAGERDPVLSWIRPDAMDEGVPGLRESVILPGAGHWIQQERPGEVNEVLLRFLRGLPG